MHVSVIIPVFNEATAIRPCLDQFAGLERTEVIVVDGGSTDGTRRFVEANDVCRWVSSPRQGRGPQMNVGAHAASGEVLLFLHADTLLPGGWREMVLDSLNDPDVVGGRFRLGLSDESFPYGLIAVLSTMRSRYLGITYGDQGIYVRRSAFDRAGGFPPVRIFEDSEFCSIVSRQGRFILLDASARSSTRRWERWGVLRTVIWMWLFRLLYLCSVSDARLSRWYRDVR